MHPPRIAHFSYQGFHRYFLTFCLWKRQRILRSADIVDPLLAQFRLQAAKHRFAIITYCFMPDHVHLLVEGLAEDSDLCRFVSAVKQATAHWFVERYGCRLWQPGFYDHVLRDDDHLVAVVRYIVANPIRAGLSSAIGEYPFAGSDVFAMSQIAECAQMWDRPARQRRQG